MKRAAFLHSRTELVLSKAAVLALGGCHVTKSGAYEEEKQYGRHASIALVYTDCIVNDGFEVFQSGLELEVVAQTTDDIKWTLGSSKTQ